MSIIKNIFQNFRKPKNSFMGRCIVKMMNQGHNRISLWCIDNFVKLSGGETVLDIGCGGGQNVANFISLRHGLFTHVRGHCESQEQGGYQSGTSIYSRSECFKHSF